MYAKGSSNVVALLYPAVRANDNLHFQNGLFLSFPASFSITLCSNKRFPFYNATRSNLGWGGAYCIYILILMPLWYFNLSSPFSSLKYILIENVLLDRQKPSQ